MRHLRSDASVEGFLVSTGCRAHTSKPACFVGGGQATDRIFQDVSGIFPNASCPGANTEITYSLPCSAQLNGDVKFI